MENQNLNDIIEAKNKRIQKDEEIIKKFDINQTKQLSKIIQNAIKENTIRIDTMEDGFGIKIARYFEPEEEIGLSGKEIGILLTNIIAAIYDEFKNGEIKITKYSSETIEKLKKIINLLNKELKIYLISATNRVSNVLAKIDYDISKKIYIGKNSDIEEIQANLYLYYIANQLEPRIVTLSLSKIELEKLISKLNEIKIKIEER
ncbi:MAG: hypothetical protein K9W46_00215 [Candidatus Heimdallarchaeum endolithica]|uniref:Uncharacterized protein n=1 Tax=Candidatus Heimdallarchaeum endolithica TaxID=2876572 RepID=A0A9Y1BQY8_9ARCH|nr:MAG: hypothetical protein K9W46_00215 [Candidatus Heimdallarchaeum endolithica]